MSIEQIVQVVVSVLTPAFPYLIKGAKTFGDNFADAFGEKSGELSAKTIQTAWKAILSREGDSVDKIKSSAEKLAEKPQDVDWQSMLQGGLTQLLKEDPSISKELAKLFNVESEQIRSLVEDSSNIFVSQQEGGSKESVVKGSSSVSVFQGGK
ncbi:MAG: hypothetical protein U9O54_06275 [Chloroflexota bacterium]|nr:hypothetical protein [Chloroflexota bacterium]